MTVSGSIMNENDIKRINELYRKSKAEGLTAEEKAEQAALRLAYIESVRTNLRSQLDNISLVNPDGSITDVKDLRKSREGE